MLPRTDLVLAALAASDGAPYTPVQVQKLFFLADENIAGFIGGKRFKFKPKDYGPFDSEVYDEIETLCDRGLAETEELGYAPRRRYRLTPAGQQQGRDILGTKMEQAAADYLRELSSWVRGKDFASLVSSIYKHYPEMKVNSVFRD